MEDTDHPDRKARDDLAAKLADHDVSRRKLLAASGAGAAVGLSGCSGLGGGTPTPRVIERERTVVKEKTVEVTPEPEPPNYVVTSHLYVTSDIGGFQHTHFAASCAPQYQFVPGQTIGLRVGIWDPDTGEQLTDDTVDSLTVTYEGPDGTTFGPMELEWNGDDEEHPADQWSVSWRDTDEAPPGQWTYTLSVTDSDSDAEFRNLGLWKNTFTLLEPSEVPTATPTPSG